MSSSWTVFVQKKKGEDLRQWLIKNSLLDQDKKIQSEKDWLIFPLVREIKESEKKTLINLFELVRFEYRVMEDRESKGPKDLFSALKDSIPRNLHEFIPKSFDVIGELVIVEIPEEIESFQARIGTALLDLHPSLTSVFKKLDQVKGEYRLRNLELIAGVDNSETIHKENTCVYKLDIKKVYFSPRLATEHLRVSSLVKKNEFVLDMFAGIGPFSILIAKQKQVQVRAVDINPAAVFYLKRNVILNKVGNLVTPSEGNVKDVIRNSSEPDYDRIIMNLPSTSSEFLDTACQVLKQDGILHYYQFAAEADFPENVVEKLEKLIADNGRKITQVLELRKVRPYAPYIWQIGVDLLVK